MPGRVPLPVRHSHSSQEALVIGSKKSGYWGIEETAILLFSIAMIVVAYVLITYT